MKLISWFEDEVASASPSTHLIDCFSAGNACPQGERRKLEEKYGPILDVSSRFDRRSVSWQLSKHDALHSWLRYKEGFSAALVSTLLDEMGIQPGDLVLDPFMGSGTTALVCQMRGVDSLGYDIMPISQVAISAKANVLRYDLRELRCLADDVRSLSMPESYDKVTPQIPITQDAYPEHNARFLQYIADWAQASAYSEEALNLLRLCVLNSLEQSSYTWKAGQYLKWDSRSPKVRQANEKRAALGRKLLPAQQVRPEILDVQEAIIGELEHVIADVFAIQNSQPKEPRTASLRFEQASVLFRLPELETGCLAGVVTSPPYCNRYDYTRTYALELVYLGVSDAQLKQMRQDLLTCTVESRPKIEVLREHYTSLGASDRFDMVCEVLEKNAALQEVLDALETRKKRGDLNNGAVVRMVRGYFTELAFVYAELYRTCKRGAQVAFVNDNVRYGGEVVPVDFLSTSLAEDLGFRAQKVYCLKQQKGNSSQQMAKFGRLPMRKSITIWQKAD